MDINEETSDEFFNSGTQTGSTDKSSMASQKLKEYGKGAYGPLMNVLHKYQDEFTPYLETLAKGLNGGAEALSTENSTDVEKYVSQFFRDSASGINEACTKLKASDFSQFSTYVSDLVDKKPSIMFSASYVAGIFFGRLGKHLINAKSLH